MGRETRAKRLMQAAIATGPHTKNGMRLIRLLGMELRKHDLSLMDIGMSECRMDGGKARSKRGLRGTFGGKRAVGFALKRGCARGPARWAFRVYRSQLTGNRPSNGVGRGGVAAATGKNHGHVFI